MRSRASLWLLLATLLTVLGLWAAHSWRSSSGSQKTSAPVPAVAAGTQSAKSASVVSEPWSLIIKPRPESTDSLYGLTAEDQAAAFEAGNDEHPLDALRELAEAGNSLAAKELGDRLISCRLGALQDTDDVTSMLMAQLARARGELELAKSESSASSRIESLASRISSLQSQVDSGEAESKAARVRCSGVSATQAWQGFDWLDRAVAMGYEPAMGLFVRTVERAFSKPAAIGRNPRKAMVLRDRARTYLSRMMKNCDEGTLWLYAWSLPTLYRLDDEQRFAAGELAVQSMMGYGMASDYVNRMKRRLEFDDLKSRLTPSQVASARKQATEIHSRCLGSGAQ